MDIAIRCQSCGMPLGTPGGFGTEADGTETHEYCKFCYQKGSFTNPTMSLEEMIQSSIEFMTENLKFDKEQAEIMSRGVIPNLKRWKK